jgi:DNA-binding CsgD family transcriptional regulator
LRGLTREDGTFYQECLRIGVGQIWGTVAIDPSGYGAALVFLERQNSAISRTTRLSLSRIAAHMAAVHRLRRAHTGPHSDPTLRAGAVLQADGSILHATGDARSQQSREALRDAVCRMERARTRSGRSDRDTALALWRALVDGRWSLVERFESDGRRILIACRNDPASRPTRLLSEMERKVIAILAVGHSLKLCAYELGRAESTVHELAASAMRKMGIRSRAALVELHGALLSDPAPDWRS